MHKAYKIIGERISKYRKEKKINQLDLSDFCNISRASLSNIESGQQRITIDLLYNIAERLGISIFKLIPADPDSEIDFLSSTRIIDSSELLKQIDEAKKANENE